MADAKDHDLANLVLELTGHPDGTYRAMFGGIGLYVDDAMFGLIADGEAYFKTDDGNRDQFIEAELEPFVFETREKRIAMSFYGLPEQAFDEQETMSEWFGPALEAARRAAAKRKKRKSKKKVVKRGRTN